MRYAVSSTVCGSLGVRAWQDMAATTAAFRHHLTSLNLPNTPGISFPSDPRPSCQQEVTYTCLGLIYVSRWCDFKGTATHMQFPPSRQLAIFPESPPVPLQKASSTTWLEYSFQLTPPAKSSGCLLHMEHPHLSVSWAPLPAFPWITPGPGGRQRIPISLIPSLAPEIFNDIVVHDITDQLRMFKPGS